MSSLSLFLLSILISLVFSTGMYFYLHHKTRIRKLYLLTDNIFVGFFSGTITYFLIKNFYKSPLPEIDVRAILLSIFISGILVIFSGFLLTMYRFWRTPKRKLTAVKGEIVSPADGKIIYIRHYSGGEVPVAEKNGLTAKLNEILQSEILNNNIWQIGINMTPFDVHKNCAPQSGKVILNKHIPGSFLSLKLPDAILRNERNTLVIRNEENELIGVVQTASKLVRRIDTYVSEGQNVEQGHWFGMIRFGSQVDLLFPDHYKVLVKPGQQVFAVSTVIAKK